MVVRNPVDWTYIDKYHERIPLREIFISTEDVIDAFTGEDVTTREAISKLLSAINEESGGLLDLKLIGAPGDDSSLTIIDHNYLGGIQSKNKPIQSTFDKLFIFDVSGKNSIVKGYDLSVAIPEGNIGNMLMIQGMSDTNQSMNLSSVMDSNMAVHSLFGNKDNKIITYLPKLSSYRAARELSDKAQAASLFDGYRDFVKDFVPDFTVNTAMFDHVDIEDPDKPKINFETGLIYETTIAEGTDAPAIQKINQEIQDENREVLMDLGFNVVDNFRDYFNESALGDWLSSGGVTGKASAFNFFTLTLTIYGIASIQPGDLFRVNYLPKLYLENVYFQVIKVKHEISADGGWFTTLETQFRTRPDKKNSNNIMLQSETVCESELADVLIDWDECPLGGHVNYWGMQVSGGATTGTKFGNNAYQKDNKVSPGRKGANVKKIIPFINKLKPYTPEWFRDPTCQISHAFEFEVFRDMTNSDVGFVGKHSWRYFYIPN